MQGSRQREERERGVPCRRRGIPAGRARRQNNKTKDAGGGRWRSERRKRGETCEQVGAREETAKRKRKLKRYATWEDGERELYCRRGGCCGARKSTGNEEGCGEGGKGRPEKKETGQECTDECVVLRATRPRRLSRERVSELSLESPLRLARPTVRIRGRRSLSRGYAETETGLLYIIHL